MQKFYYLIGLLLGASQAMAHAPPAPPGLYITTETSARASSLSSGKVSGSGTDKVREIMARSRIAYQIDLFPWKRAYTSAVERANGCVYSATRTPEREHLFHWIGPLADAEWVLFARADRGYRFKTLEDARGLRIGTYHGDAREDYLRARNFPIDSANSDQANPRKLLLKRIDLWAASLHSANFIMEQNGWGGSIVPVLTFNKVQLYLACNKGVDAGQVARMNAALEAMERDGTSRRIERKYARLDKPAATPR